MKYIVFLSGILLMTLYTKECKCQESKENEFNQFLEKFQNLDLPHEFDDSIQIYHDYYYILLNETRKKLIKSKYNEITDENFINDTCPDNNLYVFKKMAIYKYRLNKDYWAVIYNRILDPVDDYPILGHGSWLRLIIFDNMGNTIDTLALFGYSFESIEQNAKITKDFNIHLQRFEYGLKASDTKETNGYYIIDLESGKIVRKDP